MLNTAVITVISRKLVQKVSDERLLCTNINWLRGAVITVITVISVFRKGVDGGREGE